MADRVLVTGISGFIAKHVALELARSGFIVRGTVRDLAKTGRVRETLMKHGADAARLEFAAVDLTSDAGWDEAAAGCRYVAHVAAPLPIRQPSGREDLVAASRGGALRAIEAALKAGAEQIVMTSSSAAMMYRPNRAKTFTFSEGDWTDPEWPALTPYVISKTRAELAAWDLVRAKGAQGRFRTVNPVLVLGPPLDGDIGASLSVVQIIMRGTYPALPPVSFPIVDVRDVAKLHVAGLTNPATAGRRLLASAQTPSLRDMARQLARDFPAYARKIPRYELPASVVRLLALFDPTLRSVTTEIGHIALADTRYVTELTGLNFRPATEAITSAGQALVSFGLV